MKVDVDGVSDGENVIIGAIVEHIDSAGVHSGDAMMCIPPWRLSNKIIENITDSTIRIAKEFRIKGPFNLQFLIHNDQEYVIELNIRASRSMPFVSKLVRTNLISLAAKAALGKPLPENTSWKMAEDSNTWDQSSTIFIYAIRWCRYCSWSRKCNLLVKLHVLEIAFYDALAKGLTSVGYNLPK